VSAHEREGLIARIRQIRRTAEASTTRRRKVAVKDDATPLQALQARVEHLEQLVEALQDSVHRESERQDKRITMLEGRIEPAALSVALSEDARRRGL
jgi:predicted RNase H-like nuclease (RuvC/YqgF family)